MDLEGTITHINELIESGSSVCDECGIDYIELKNLLEELLLLRGYAEYSRTSFEGYKRQYEIKKSYSL